MRVEILPVIVGIIVMLLGLAFLWDAWGPELVDPMRERRRRVRASIDPAGEKLVGLGTVILGAALIGRDWRGETLTILVGTALVVAGATRNRHFIRETLLFRGAARRGLQQELRQPEGEEPSRRLRIR